MSLPGPEATIAELRKARGAFFTPPSLCRYIVDWAIREPDDEVLEPSCGEAAFLLEAGQRLSALRAGSPEADGGVLHGVELHEESAREALALLQSQGHDGSVTVADFFCVDPIARYDAVVGNPPYVRYQDFVGESRARSREAALRAGVPLTRLASSWASFTVHAALFLKPQGRLGLVLPAELLSVNYAAEVRRFLMERFARVRLVLFTDRVFPGVLEEVVLLLAEGAGPTDHCELYQVRNVAHLVGTEHAARRWKPDAPGAKWTPSLLSSSALETYQELATSDAFGTLHEWGETTLGMVTGNNNYFTLTPERAADLGLLPTDVLRLSPPGSRHLRALTLTDAVWNGLGEAGQRTLLFRPEGEPSKAALAYIDAGEALAVGDAYKCRIRAPWWRVPLVPPADLLLTYMNADTPRLCTNRTRAYHLNSVHGVYLRPGLRRLGMDYLPLASLNSMTLLGAETVGRAYGGGMLKLEPREADRLPVPSMSLVAAAAKDFTAKRSLLSRVLREEGLLRVVDLVDGLMLVGIVGMPLSRVAELRDARAELAARRVARGADPRDGD